MAALVARRQLSCPVLIYWRLLERGQTSSPSPPGLGDRGQTSSLSPLASPLEVCPWYSQIETQQQQRTTCHPRQTLFCYRRSSRAVRRKSPRIALLGTGIPHLSPVKRRGNRRYYQRADVITIRQIRSLLYDQGYTIGGAKQQLSNASQESLLASWFEFVIGNRTVTDSGLKDEPVWRRQGIGYASSL